MYRKGIIKRMLAATLTAVMLLSSAPSTLVNAAQLPETVISDVAEEQSEEATEMLSGNEITGDETPDNETSEDPTEADSDKTGGGGWNTGR